MSEPSPVLEETRAETTPTPPSSKRLVNVKRGDADDPPVRYRARGANKWRFIRAYTTTFTVIFSYLWLFWKAKAFGKAYRDANIDKIHRRNAARVYDTILELQGLFI